ncbi:hypothetical protein DFH94DRAFT_680202 [Russula ochroleuca]|uniref:Uncharacterized protein n=1 Tax=Russula ochroleuca TaxID=152965 RepID=A0A9P5N150_9AGAM|nr:hypothetical protein DFH94DRAFT_680202 [Russula ochroleuca]
MFEGVRVGMRVRVPRHPVCARVSTVRQASRVYVDGAGVATSCVWVEGVRRVRECRGVRIESVRGRPACTWIRGYRRRTRGCGVRARRESICTWGTKATSTSKAVSEGEITHGEEIVSEGEISGIAVTYLRRTPREKDPSNSHWGEGVEGMHVGMGVDASWVGVKGVSVASGMDVDIEGARVEGACVGVERVRVVDKDCRGIENVLVGDWGDARVGAGMGIGKKPEERPLQLAFEVREGVLTERDRGGPGKKNKGYHSRALRLAFGAREGATTRGLR